MWETRALVLPLSHVCMYVCGKHEPGCSHHHMYVCSWESRAWVQTPQDRRHTCCMYSPLRSHSPACAASILKECMRYVCVIYVLNIHVYVRRCGAAGPVPSRCKRPLDRCTGPHPRPPSPSDHQVYTHTQPLSRYVHCAALPIKKMK